MHIFSCIWKLKKFGKIFKGIFKIEINEFLKTNLLVYSLKSFHCSLKFFCSRLNGAHHQRRKHFLMITNLHLNLSFSAILNFLFVSLRIISCKLKKKADTASIAGRFCRNPNRNKVQLEFHAIHHKPSQHDSNCYFSSNSFSFKKEPCIN